MTNKISLGINIVLAILVAILYFLHFNTNSSAPITQEQTKSSVSTENEVAVLDLPRLNIAYINIDTINKRYNYIRTLESNFKSKRDNAEKKLARQYEELEKEYMMFAEQAQKGLITEEKGMKMEASFRDRQQRLIKEEQDLGVELQKAQVKMHDELLSKISNYLKKYNEDAKYSYIMAYGKESPILYASDSLEITSKVLTGLNEELEAKKAAKK